VLDPAAFAEFVGAQYFSDWLVPLATSPCAQALLPADFIERLALRRDAQPARVARLVAQTAELRDALGGAGIECLVLKGLAHAARFHPEPERRHQWDVDLLVHEAALHDVFRTLGRMGYLARRQPADGAVVADWVARVRSGALHRGKHSLEARRDDARVDVHWRIGGRLADRVDHAALRSARQPFTLRGERFETLGDEHALALLLQGIAADLKRGALKGKQLLDLHLALRVLGPHTDWDAFLARRSREGLLRVAVNVLALLRSAWSCESELPALAAALARHRRRVLLPDAADALALLRRPRGASENVRWYRQLYPRSRLQHAAWRLVDARPRARGSPRHAGA
jgi:hypothetical protein